MSENTNKKLYVYVPIAVLSFKDDFPETNEYLENSLLLSVYAYIPPI